jgi:hypothetical protein
MTDITGNEGGTARHRRDALGGAGATLRRGSKVDGRSQIKRAPKNEQPRCAGAPDPPRGPRRLDKGTDRVRAWEPPSVAEAAFSATAFFLERQNQPFDAAPCRRLSSSAASWQSLVPTKGALCNAKVIEKQVDTFTESGVKFICPMELQSVSGEPMSLVTVCMVGGRPDGTLSDVAHLTTLYPQDSRLKEPRRKR